jgi:O-antigen ligase
MGTLNGTTFVSGKDQRWRSIRPSLKKATNGPFFWLCAFFLVYCARPEDWIPGLKYLPLAKITAIFAFLGLLSTLGKTKRKMKDLPREANYLLALIGLLLVSGFLSPIWRGGGVSHALDFAKVYVAWVLTFLLVTDFTRLKKIIYIQAAAVVVISAVSIVMGRNHPRLEGVIGGIYSNPNDLAFAVALTMPFCLAFCLTAKGMLAKLSWIAGMLIMTLTLFLTASRGGFVTLVVTGTVVLWHFGIRGRRLFLVVGSGLAVVMVMAVAGGPLIKRMESIAGTTDTQQQEQAYESYEQRVFLMKRAVQCIGEYPILGVGVRNFQVYSGVWHDVHMTYLQVAAEGGIPSLILYLLFFARAFSNLRKLRRRKDLDVHTTLFVGGLHSSLIGFVVGASFAPEAYQYFPYFAVAYTSALVATIAEQKDEPKPIKRPGLHYRFGEWRGNHQKPDAVTIER